MTTSAIEDVQKLLQTVISFPLPSSTGVIIAGAIPMILMMVGTIMRLTDTVDTLNKGVPEENFDFIVVGGGSSGAAVAARLSERFKVLLLEAGTDPNPLTYIPGMSPYLLYQSEIDWDVRTERLEHAAKGMVNESILITAGKSLGGTSNTNFMIYNRGNPEDFNFWAQHSGDQRWAFANVEKVYQRIEDYHGYYQADGYHKQGGPLYIEGTLFNPSREYWLKAAKEMGYEVRDPNQNQTQSFSPIDSTHKRGCRFSTYKAYIAPAEQKHGLTINRYSKAIKINFDSKKRAISVTYIRHGHERTAKASKEIIVSAGAIRTPKLLMLSGIGPKEHLKSHGITPLSDLPVGQNHQDHIAVLVGPFLLNKSVSFIPSRDMTLQAVMGYATEGNGPFSSASIETGQVLFSTTGVPTNWPNVLVLMTGLGVDESLGDSVQNTFGLKPGILQKYYGYNAGNDSNFCGVTLGRPKSRGWVKLRDGDHESEPMVQPNFFSVKDDIDSVVEGIQKIVHLYENAETYKSLGARLAPNHFPGCEQFELKSKAYWECYATTFTGTIFHSSGTCKMGKASDPTSVVDSQLRVLGVTGLRVADTSIMPTITNTNTNAPAIMIGEMCADIILEEYK